mmetsp:Transcript_35172/g.53903  ORF Transcript_35172/g.53903 Transcript_35172/m.53903 type:complete len:96 (+) Transcript_35172:469-756(+)
MREERMEAESKAMFSCRNFVDTILFFFIKVLNYGFMLAAMTFNFWVVLTMVLSIPVWNCLFSIIEDRQYLHTLKQEQIAKKKVAAQQQVFSNNMI